MTRLSYTHSVCRVQMNEDGDPGPERRRRYTSSEAAVASLRRWIAETEAGHVEHAPGQPIRYRFFIYEQQAFFRSQRLEAWHENGRWHDRGVLA